MKIVKYVITIMDVLNNTCYNDTVDTDTEVKIKYDKLKKSKSNSPCLDAIARTLPTSRDIRRTE